MRIKSRSKSKMTAMIPSSSMADIAFLLIIFFMVTTTITPDKTHVNLPKSIERIEIPKNVVYITMTKNYELKFQGEFVQLYDLPHYIREELSDNSERIFALKIDKTVRYEYVNEILEALRKAKAKNLTLPTQQETINDSRGSG